MHNPQRSCSIVFWLSMLFIGMSWRFKRYRHITVLCPCCLHIQQEKVHIPKMKMRLSEYAQPQYVRRGKHSACETAFSALSCEDRSPEMACPGDLRAGLLEVLALPRERVGYTTSEHRSSCTSPRYHQQETLRPTEAAHHLAKQQRLWSRISSLFMIVFHVLGTSRMSFSDCCSASQTSYNAILNQYRHAQLATSGPARCI